MKIQLFPRWAVALVLGVAISLTGPAALAAQKKTPTPAADDASKTSKSDTAGKINLNTADEKTVAGAKGAGDAHRSLATELAPLSGAGASGGLTNLVNMFNQKGLGEVVSSWISTGKNLPISAEQIQSVPGSSQVQALAAKAGITSEKASNAIAQILPHLVDKSTPNGQMPSGGGLLDSLSGLLRKG
jgi:uncharacterized protein YidB (DUF937 family)